MLVSTLMFVCVGRSICSELGWLESSIVLMSTLMFVCVGRSVCSELGWLESSIVYVCQSEMVEG